MTRTNGSESVVIRRQYADNMDGTTPTPGVTTIVEEQAFTGTNPHTEVRTTTVDSRGLLLSSTETIPGKGPQTTRYTYDAQGRPRITTFPDNKTEQLEYDKAGRLHKRLDGEGKETIYEYEGELLRSINSPHAKSLVTFEYDDGGRLTFRKEKLESGATSQTEYTYPSPGVVKTKDALGNETERTLLASGQVSREVVTLASGTYEVARTWDGSALRTEQRREGTWQSALTLDYHPSGRLKQSIESFTAPGVSWTATDDFSLLRNPSTITHAWTMGSLPATPSVLPSNANTVTDIITFDALGLPTRHQRGALVDTFTNDAAGRRVEAHPSNSAITLYKFGSDGRLAEAAVGSGAEVTRLSYDTRGRLHRIEAPEGVTTQEWDGRGLMLSRTHRGFTTNWTYDDEGNVETQVIGGKTTRFTHGPQGELLSTELPSATKWSYEYDALARLKKVTPPAGPLLEQRWEYDALGRVRQHIDGTKTWNMPWEDGANKTFLPDGLGTLTTLRDSRGRLLSLSGTGGTGGPQSVSKYSFFYDGLDGLRFAHEEAAAGAARSSASTTYSRDASHRLTGVDRNGDVVIYGFDGASTRIETETHAGTTVTREYDSLDRLRLLQGPWGDTNVSWRPGGKQLESLTDSNSLATEVFNYTPEGWIQSITLNGAPSRTYSHDARGNPTSESDGTRTRRFAYDDDDRLIATQEWSGEVSVWRLHPDGNRAGEKRFPASAWVTAPPAFTDLGHTLERDYVYDSATGALQQVLDVTTPTAPFPVATWEHDAAGRVTLRTAGGQSVTPTWDVYGRMTSAGGLSFECDGQGMRRRVTGVGLAPRSFTYVGETLIAEDGKPHVGVGGLAVALGEVRFGHDALGSVIHQASASASSSATYSAWGLQSGGPQLTSVGFTGYLEEPLARAKFAKQRWIDEEFGVFLSRDSVGASSRLASPNGMGPWSYAKLSPLRYVDPDGRWELDPGYSGQPASPAVQAEGFAFAYHAYRHGIQTAGAGVHWAAWKWTEAAEGMLSIPTSTPGVYISTPESRVVASGLGAGVEFTASLPVAIAGIGLMPEMLWNSGDEYRKAREEIRQGWVYGNEELYLTGVARMSGTVGLWAGAASMGMSRVPLLNEAPVSQLVRPSNWNWATDPQVVYSGVPPPKYVGPRRLAGGIERQTIKLTDPKWRETKFSNPSDSIVYVLKDATGEVLKVGKSEVSTFSDRFEPYQRAGERTGRALEIEAFAFDAEGFTAETLEKALREKLTSDGHSLPWDNTEGRLGRQGPGVPGAPIPRRLRDEWRWDYEEETLVPLRRK